MKVRKLLLRMIFYVSVIYILATVGLIAINASYSVFGSDDFLHANRIRECGSVFAYVKYMYMTWQGSYTSTFLEGLLSPLVRGGYRSLRAIMVANALLTSGSIYWLIYTVFHVRSEENLYTCTWASASMLFLLMSYRGYPEVFTWFSGAVYYSIPLAFGCFGISCFMWACRGKMKYFNVILAAIGIFLGCGGNLVISGVIAVIVLVVCIYYLYRKGFRFWILLIFLLTIGGGVINVIAPGNFIHHEMIAEGIHPFAAFVHSYSLAVDGLLALFKSPFGRLAMISGIGAGSSMVYKKAEPLTVWGLLCILGVFLGFIAIYPLSLGYGNAFLPNRAAFILDCIMTTVLLSVAMCIGAWLSYAFRRLRFPIFPLFVVLFFFNVYLSGNALSLSHEVEMFKTNYRGEGATYMKEVQTILDTASNSHSNLVISYLPKAPATLHAFELSNNPKNANNQEVATYYGIESIVLDSGN